VKNKETDCVFSLAEENTIFNKGNRLGSLFQGLNQLAIRDERREAFHESFLSAALFERTTNSETNDKRVIVGR
jgi:hypothetical protein